jgi:hypothetical protein
MTEPESRLIRGDLFTMNGKWKYHITLTMTHDAYGLLPANAIRVAWEKGCPEVVSGLTGYRLVVLEPYSVCPIPVMIEV